MAPIIFLITKKYLSEYTPVDNNHNENEVKNAMTDASLFDLNFLGLPLLDLFTSHTVSGTTLTDVQAQLLSMVKYFNAYRVYYHLSFNMFNVTNRGVTQAPDSLPYADLKEVRGQIDAKCASLKRQILEFIAKNQGALPQAAPQPETPLTNDPLDTLGVVWSPNTQHYYY